jgi:hypothetical protein
MLNYIRSYLRSIKEYIPIRDEITKSFFLTRRKINSKENKNVNVTETKNQVEFSDKLIERMKKILSNKIKVSGHWVDMYDIGNKENTFTKLLAMDNKSFYNELANPHKNNLHYGFGDISHNAINNHRVADFYIDKTVYDTVFRICCSLDIEPYPETYHFHNFNYKKLDEMLENIFKKLGKKSNFPNIFIGEFGLKSKFGIVSFAPIQQMYHAIKVLEFTKTLNKEARVMEIGAGLGLSAYHARNFGIKDYTILDLSLGSLSQSFFFSSTIGEDNIIIGDEVLNYKDTDEDFKNKLKLIPSTSSELVPDNIDLVINCDSITEMSKEDAISYVNLAAKKSRYFLSLNHDNNKFKISDIFSNTPFERVYRVPTWYRSGYIEELYVNTSFN